MVFAGFLIGHGHSNIVLLAFNRQSFSMHGFLLSSLWAILRHNGDDDASVLLLIEDGG